MRLIPVLLSSLLCAGAAAPADLFSAIRAGDDAAVRQLAQRADLRDSRQRGGMTPLHAAAAFGTEKSLRMLLAAGADPKATDESGTTPLHYAACSPVRVRMLLKAGAGAGTASKGGRTPLMVASSCGNAQESVKLLLAAGADPNATTEMGGTALLQASFGGGPAIMHQLLDAGAKASAVDRAGYSPLMIAAAWNDARIVRRLLAGGAQVNHRTLFSGRVVHGDIALKQMTPLMAAAPYASEEVLRVLLDAGAGVNDKDGRGMTPLAFAAASGRRDPRTVQLLLERGADVNAANLAGETPLDWSRKYADNAVADILLAAGAKAGTAPIVQPPQAEPAATRREAALRGIRLVQQGNESFFAKSNCVACHHQPMAAAVVRAARTAGAPYDEKQFSLMKQTMTALLAPRPGFLLTLDPGPAGLDGVSNTTLALADAGVEPGLLTDSAAAFLAATQSADGSWQEPRWMSRAPLLESPITQTVSALRAMQAYALPARRVEFAARVAKTRQWLLAAKPRSSHERAERLIGLSLTGVSGGALRTEASRLAAQQNADGSWSQRPGAQGDPYATALAVRALGEVGSRGNAAYAKGVAWLVAHQRGDGSWYLPSRAVKLQPYFQSGFPYDHEQWISYVATAQATAALLEAGEQPVAISSAKVRGR